MATYYYDLSAGTNGTGTTVSPFNGSVWPGAALAAGDSHLFKRGSSRAFAFTVGTAGTAGNLIKFGAWYNADGSDDTSQAKPIITTTTQITTFGGAKDYIWLDSLDVRATLTVGNDISLFFCGNGCKVTNCRFDSNCGCIGSWNKSNVTIQDNTLFGVSHSSANNNQLIMVSNTPAIDAIDIINNHLYHYGGGGASSHSINIDPASTNPVTNLRIINNFVTTNSGTYNANIKAFCIRFIRCDNPEIGINYCYYHQVGIFGSSPVQYAARIYLNGCFYNYHFGIQLTTGMYGCTIERNECAYNGTSTNDGVTLFAYGRGMELSSAAGQGSNGGHTIRFNNCHNNYNWGGPVDNGSEGVGIGIDDGCVACTIYGNTLTDNEGNGIQLYGGGNSATWTDTHNIVVSNFFRNNCTNSITNRRSGGTHANYFCADINCSYTIGDSLIANNTFGGTSRAGIAIDSHCTSITTANNIFLSVSYPIMFGGTEMASHNNDYYNSVQPYSTQATDINGSPTFATSSYTGTNDFTFDPQLDANYDLISVASPAYHAGADYVSSYVDRRNYSFYPTTPTLGMYEFFNDRIRQPGGRERKLVFRKR